MPERARAAIGTLERILHLRKVPTFAGLKADELATIAETLRERQLRRGERLLGEGEPVGAHYLVVDGLLRVCRRGRALSQAGPGQAVGGLNLLARDPEGLDVVAGADSLVLEFDTDAVLEVFEDNFDILHHVLRDICRRLLRMLAEGRALPWEPMVDLPAAGVTRELDLVDRILLLRRSEAFSEGSINALVELSRNLAEVSFPAHVTLWTAGEPAGYMLLLVDGRLRISAPGRAGGSEVGPGTPVGALECMAEEPRWFEATSLSPLVALSGNFETLIDVFEDNFEMAMNYLAVMARLLLRSIDLCNDAEAARRDVDAPLQAAGAAEPAGAGG